MSDSETKTPVLDVRKLTTCFSGAEGKAVAVDAVDLFIEPGEVVGLVGESGCGKTALALSVLDLIPSPPGRIEGGQVLFQGKDLLKMKARDLRGVRGRRIAMIFQEPMKALNPVIRVGEQIAEVCRLHLGKSRAEADAMAVEMLNRVQLPDPARRAREYPHQLSGGMQQRVMIAMALVCRPELLLADEPTTALDVTVQAQILELLQTLQREERMAVLLITHDLSVVREMAGRAYVMYASNIVERAGARDLLGVPRHPYTAGLLKSSPKMGPSSGRLAEIPGQVPNLRDLPRGCRFHPRCFNRQERCSVESPVLREIEPGRWVACHFPVE